MERLLIFFAKYPLDFIAHLSSSLPIITGLFRYKYLTNASRLIVVFFTLFFFKETYSLVLALAKTNNLFLQNLDSIFETVFCGLIFYYAINKPLERKIIGILGLLFTLLLIYFYKSDAVSDIDLSIFRIYAIILTLLYFNRLLIDMHAVSIMHHTLFWFSSSLLLYSAGTFFIVLFSEYWYQGMDKVPADVFDQYWNASQILFILFALLSAVGLWMSKYDRSTIKDATTAI